MKKVPCQCPRCFDLVTLAILREMIGDQNGADYLISQVTMFDPLDASEGYADVWQTPTTKTDQTWGN